jgi:hypothetical protein
LAGFCIEFIGVISRKEKAKTRVFIFLVKLNQSEDINRLNQLYDDGKEATNFEKCIEI